MSKTKKAPEAESPKKSKEIVIKETEDDVVFDGSFSANPEEFKDEIKKEAEKADVFSKFIIPVIVFLLIGGASAAATWYYAKPEHTAAPSTENKIQTPPKVEQPSTETPAATREVPVTQTPTATPAPTTSTSSQTYTVQEGDTMSGIANKYGMTSQELANYNNLSDVNALHIGQVLKVPAK